MILPHFNYCNLIWGRASASLLNRLIILQKQAIRLCTGSQYRAHTDVLFKRLHTLPLLDMITYKTGIFMYKYKHNMLPPAFINYFVTHSEIHSRNTRNRSDIYPPIFRTSRAQNQSIKNQGTKIWNSGIPANLKCLFYHNFKKKYRKYLTMQ